VGHIGDGFLVLTGPDVLGLLALSVLAAPWSAGRPFTRSTVLCAPGSVADHPQDTAHPPRPLKRPPRPSTGPAGLSGRQVRGGRRR